MDSTVRHATSLRVASRALPQVLHGFIRHSPVRSLLVSLLALSWAGCVESDHNIALESRCASGIRWRGVHDEWTPGKPLVRDRNHRGAKEMHPGRNCIACHGISGDPDAPDLLIAGTVYRHEHERDDCYGQGGGGEVVITDKRGKRYHLPINLAGNFYLERSAAPGFVRPFRAKVVANGREREMPVSQTIGSCNFCHAANGRKGYPSGRVLLPAPPADGGAADGAVNLDGGGDGRAADGATADGPKRTPDSSTRDTTAPTRDGGSVIRDTGSLSPDTGSLSPDTGSLSPDTGSLSPDTGSLSPDTGFLSPDSAPVDSGVACKPAGTSCSRALECCSRRCIGTPGSASCSP